MEYLQVLPVSLLSSVVLFILTKLMGYKQVSQLSMFDYIIGISIGSIAAEMATELSPKSRRPLRNNRRPEYFPDTGTGFCKRHRGRGYYAQKFEIQRCE